MNRFKYLNLLTMVCVILAFALVSCADKKPAMKPALPQKLKPVATAGNTVAVAATDEVKAEKEVYNYEPKGRRDPFIPLTDVMKAKPTKRKGASPTEGFDIDEIKLIAIAWDNQQYYALVTLPDKKSYTLKKGTILGLYGGRVRDITRDSVIITEQIKDYKGQLKTKDTILKLRKEGEE